MPACTGKTRRPNMGKGSTKTTSISFSRADYDWMIEQSQARGVSQSLVIADAIDLYRRAQLEEISEMEKEQKRAARAALAAAPTEDDSVEF